MNFKFEPKSKYELPRPAQQPKVSHDFQSERVMRAMQRAGKNRVKHIDEHKAQQIRDVMDEMGKWGGWA